MPGLTLIDAAALLFVVFRVARAGRKSLGESLHALISLILLIGLFLGFRVAPEIRTLLGEAADFLQAIPGLGTKLLVIVGAWYLMRLLRTRSGDWLESAVPKKAHRRVIPVSEGIRALLLLGFLAWLAEGLFPESPQTTPLLIDGVRNGDAWVMRALQPSPRH